MAKKNSKESKELLEKVKKERRRIQQFVNRATKKGYSFPENVIPSIPKTVSEKTLERFKNITPEKLYAKSIYTSPEGVKIRGSSKRKKDITAQRKRAEQKRKKYYSASKRKDKRARSKQGEGTAPTPETDTVLRQIEDLIENWTPSDAWSPALVLWKTHDKNLLKNALNMAIAEEGRDNVAKRCQENASYVVAIAEQVLYGSGNDYKVRGVEGVNQDIQLFKTIITGKSPTITESLELNDLAEADATSYE